MSIADVLDAASKAGTLSMQGLMLAGIIILGWVARYQHKENRATINEFVTRLDSKENAMTAERIARINMLMEVLREDTQAKHEVSTAIVKNTEAIDGLKTIIHKLEDKL